MTTAEIRSIGAYVPKRAVSNDELPKELETSDEWIRSHTGIGNRHIIAPDQATSDLGLEASKIALERANLEPKDLDLIITATASGDYPGFPATACLIQHGLGLEEIPAFDLAAGCTGFIYSIEVARSMILSGLYKNILVVGAEALTRIANWSDRNTAVLFGDGAGAVVVTANESGDGRGILHTILKAEGAGAEYLMRKAGGSRQPFVHGETPDEDMYLSMNGRRVYGFAVRVNTILVNSLLKETNLTLDDITYIVPHQANERIIQAAAERLKIPIEKFYLNMGEYANTSAASVPIALNEMSEKGLLKKGDLIITLGFGAGLTYGGSLIRW